MFYNRNIKFYLTADIDFERVIEDSTGTAETNKTTASFRSYPEAILNNFDIKDAITDCFEQIANKIETFISNGSCWTFKAMPKITLNVSEYKSIDASSYVKTPDFLISRHAIVNVRNKKDEKCFLYSILAYLFTTKKTPNRYRVGQYKKMKHDLNFDGITFPVRVQQIAKFEKQNQDISINLSFFDNTEKKILPLYASKEKYRKHEINLLMLYGNDKLGNPTKHYTLISDLSALLSHKTKTTHKLYVCHFCMHRCSNHLALTRHSEICKNHKFCRISFPSKFKKQKKKVINQTSICTALDEDDVDNGIGDYDEEEIHDNDLDEITGMNATSKSDRQYIAQMTKTYASGGAGEEIEEDQDAENILKFKQYQYTFPLKFAIYFDFECFIQEINGEKIHVPSGFSCIRVSSMPKYKLKPYTFSDDTPEVVMTKFFKYLHNQDENIQRICNVNKPMNTLTAEQENEFRQCNLCSCCNESNRIMTRHHCHLTGNYIGPICQRCNLCLKEYRMRSNGRVVIPVVAHNLGRYDMHLIIKYLHCAKSITQGVKPSDILLLANSMEQYTGMQILNLKFVDSYKFLSAGLSALVDTMMNDVDGKQKFVNIKDQFPDSEKFELMSSKGIFPYSYMRGRDNFQETALPPIESFYNDLTESEIEPSEYERALRVWDVFKMRTMKDYHDTYLLSDTLLLADVFEAFRKSSMEYYKLDPLYFWGTPGLAQSAALRMCGAKIELLTSHDMLLFFEDSIRGGFSCITNRFAEANNKYMGPKFDPEKPISYLAYYDCINLYGMSYLMLLF